MKERVESSGRRLKYAMVGGGRGSFIGPVHRAAIRMDDLASYNYRRFIFIGQSKFIEAVSDYCFGSRTHPYIVVPIVV